MAEEGVVKLEEGESDEDGQSGQHGDQIAVGKYHE